MGPRMLANIQGPIGTSQYCRPATWSGSSDPAILRVYRNRTAIRNAGLLRQRTKRRDRWVARCRAECSPRRVSVPAPLWVRGLRRPARQQLRQRAIGFSFQCSVTSSVSSGRSTRLRYFCEQRYRHSMAVTGRLPPRLRRPAARLFYSNAKAGEFPPSPPLLLTHIGRFNRPGGAMSGSYPPQNQLHHCPTADRP